MAVLGPRQEDIVRVPEHSFSLPMLGLTGLKITDLVESELDSICKDPSRLHDLRLDAHEELKRREVARKWNPEFCDCIADAAMSGPTLCDYCMDTPR